MNSEIEIKLYDQVPTELRSSQNYKSTEKHHADFFWNYCAEDWHEKHIHKVYTLVSQTEKCVLGFFSIRANQIELKIENEKQYIPIADVAFIDVSNDLDDESSEKIFRSLLEFIEHICTKLTQMIGCRYIRIYLPTLPETTQEGKIKCGKPIYSFLEKLYSQLHYFEPPIKDSKKIRKIRNKKNKEKIAIVLKYYLRDLLVS